MAGDWIKMECETPDKPEVLALTALMGWDDPDITVGKLFRLWRWFDQHTIAGNAAGVTPALLDRLIGVSGFVTKVAEVGWISIDSNGISLSNFDRHNGASAKKRSVTAKRVSKHKAKVAQGIANASGNADGVTSALPREEKRREDISTSLRSVESAKPRATRKCPESFQVDDELLAWAAKEAPSVDLQAETAKLRDHTFKTAISDWRGAWRNWMRRSQGFAGPTSNDRGRVKGRTPSAAEIRLYRSSPHLMDQEAFKVVEAHLGIVSGATSPMELFNVIDMEACNANAISMG